MALFDDIGRDPEHDPAARGRVIARELSANAAAIGAGFRKKPIKHCPNCGHEW